MRIGSTIYLQVKSVTSRYTLYAVTDFLPNLAKQCRPTGGAGVRHLRRGGDGCREAPLIYDIK